MAVFDEAAAERVLKRMRVGQLRNELESRGEDASGTAGRLRTRLLDVQRRDAMDVDDSAERKDTRAWNAIKFETAIIPIVTYMLHDEAT